VLAAGGDGDGFSIGGGHVPHAIRRNDDLAYIVMDNQIYGLTKGQLSPTSAKGRKTVTSVYGSFENPVNPLMYVLAYGAPFVAQGTPADIVQLAAMIEEAIRFPGFAFVNVESPCVTYGEEDQQIKHQKLVMKRLEDLGHDPTSRIQALDRAQSYGRELVTGVYFRDPSPPPTLASLVAERQREHGKDGPSRERILDLFLQ
jgi:2-oxoglutarate/2-oxoacid ferredoxin oxidoreductase subunit beta